MINKQIAPIFLKNDSKELKLLANLPKTTIFDLFQIQAEELLEISYPNLELREINRQNFLKKKLDKNNGTWVYLPWKNYLFHILNERDFHELRTNRNRNLLSMNELEKLKNVRIGIAGLSIGSNLAYILSHQGFRSFKLADFDQLSTSNLNRVHATLAEIGKNKAVLTAQNIIETDPYSDLEVDTEGVNKKNLEKFLDGEKKLSVVIDSIDDFEMKIKLRQKSRELKIPVLMFTNLGDSTLIDVERYDTDQDLTIFNNLLGDVPDEILNSVITEKNKNNFVAKLVGVENIPTKALKSLTEMGKTLVGRPQLASTVNISAGLGSFLIRKIVLDDYCPSGRYLVHYDKTIFDKRIMNPYEKDDGRQEILEKLLNSNG